MSSAIFDSGTHFVNLRTAEPPPSLSVVHFPAMNGAIYIVTKNPLYLNLLRASATRLKQLMPDLPVTVFSDLSVEGPFDRVIQVESSSDGFYDKARLMSESPYDRTIFIDSDIYVVQPFDELFPMLDRFDCALTHEEYLNTDWSTHYPRHDIPASFPEFNTGIMVYRRSPVMMDVLRNWCDLYRSFTVTNSGKAINDQPFFRAAAYYGDAAIATLGREYNCKFRGQGYLNGPVKLLHGHVKFQMNPVYMQRVAGVMNASLKPRVYVGGKVYEQKITGRLWGRRQAHKVGTFPEPLSLWVLRARRVRDLFHQYGLRGVARKLIGRSPQAD